MRDMTRGRWKVLMGTLLLVLIVGPALYVGASWAIVEQALVAEAKPFEQTPEAPVCGCSGRVVYFLFPSRRNDDSVFVARQS